MLTVNVTVFWNVTPCSLVERYQRVVGLSNLTTLKKEIADLSETLCATMRRQAPEICSLSTITCSP